MIILSYMEIKADGLILSSIKERRGMRCVIRAQVFSFLMIEYGNNKEHYCFIRVKKLLFCLSTREYSEGMSINPLILLLI